MSEYADGPYPYERIVYRSDSGPTKTVILTDIRERHSQFGDLLSGAEVDREGSRVGRQHLISADLIVWRTQMVMDRHFGELKASPKVSSR